MPLTIGEKTIEHYIYILPLLEMEAHILGLNGLMRLKATIALGNKAMGQHNHYMVRKKIQFNEHRNINQWDTWSKMML